MDECEDSPVILDFFLLPEKWNIIKFVIIKQLISCLKNVNHLETM